MLSYGQTIEFQILDSVIHKSSLARPNLTDVYTINGELISRFDALNKDSTFSLELVSTKRRFTFTHSDNTMLSENGNLFESEETFTLIKYSGESNLIEFNKKNNSTKLKQLNYDTDRLIVYPNCGPMKRQSSSKIGQQLLMTISETDIRTRNEQHFKESLKEILNNDSLFILYDLANDTYIRIASYPEYIRQNLNQFSNIQPKFTYSENQNLIYISFDKCNEIFVYDLKINSYRNNILCEQIIDNQKSNLQISTYQNREEISLHSIIFEDIFVSNNTIIRTFSKPKLESSKDWQISKTAKCPSASKLTKIYSEQLDKDFYAIFIDSKSNKSEIIKYPNNCNELVGINEQAGIYFFRTKNPQKVIDREISTIYICKKTSKSP